MKMLYNDFIASRPLGLANTQQALLLLSILSLLLLPARVFAANTYYIAASGNDSNNGMSSSTPWQSLSKITSTTLTGGDSVLLNRGDVFATSSLDIFNKSGNVGNPLNIGSYGTGPNPRISRPNSYALSIGGNSSNVSISDIDLNSTTTAALPYSIYLYNTGSNISFSNVNVATTGTAIQFDSAANVTNATFTNFMITGATLRGLNVSGTVSGLTFSSSTIRNATSGINISPSATTTNVLIDRLDIRNLPSVGINLGKVDGITISNTNLSLNNIGIQTGPGAGQMTRNFTIASTTISSSTTYGIIFQNPTQNLTVSNVTVEKSGNHGMYFPQAVTGFSITNSTSTNNLGPGASGMSFTGNASGTVSNVYLSYNNFSGFNASNAGTVYVTDAEASNNIQDGFDVGGTTYVECNRCVANNNGDDGVGGDGDGFSFHNTSTGIIKNSMAINNKEASVYNVDATSVQLFNNVFIHDTVGTLALVRFFGQHALNNNLILSKAQNGIGAEAIATTTMRNNNIYGFYNGISGNSIATAENNNIFNNASSSYVCQTTCVAAGAGSKSSNPLFADLNGGDYRLTALSQLIDGGTTISGRTSDRDGNPIYGAPDIGPYEYQPPYIMGSSAIDPTGAIRVYQNGRFRYTQATSSSETVGLSAAPVGGFDANLYGEYMNISGINWAGNNKQWTASSDVATTTVFTLSGLLPNTLYTVRVDGVVSTTSASEGAGSLSFAYSGGWSEHAFSVEPHLVAPTVSLTVMPGSQTAVSAPALSSSELIAIFGNLAAAEAASSSGSGPARDIPADVFLRDLSVGAVGTDVWKLQVFLNRAGFAVSRAGAGSSGNETDFFGAKTRAALAKFQRANRISPSVGYFGPLTRAFIKTQLGTK